MLSFQQAPSISVPLRFFLTAPFFGALAGLVLLWVGPEAFQSRWAPATLALTHLFTAGFMLQVMCGALLQFIPVAAGGNIWRPTLVAGFVHPTISIAALLFAGGFLSANHALLDIAAALFLLALGAYALAAGLAVWRTPANSPTITAIRLAVGGLAITVVLGVLLVETLQGRVPFAIATLTDVHAAWGLGGWGLMLLVGVSFFVVPMFQMTPVYPKPLQRYLPLLLVTLLVVGSMQLWVDHGGFWKNLLLAMLALCASLFAGVTLFLHQQRKRKVSDPTLLFFRGAMLCLLAASASWIGLQFISTEPSNAALWIGVLIVPGAFASAICGMLYKIVPFVIWMHLSNREASGASRLNTRMMLSETAMNRHLRLHFIALLVLLAAVLAPALAQIAGALLVLSYVWLGWNLIAAARIYARLLAVQTTPQAKPTSPLSSAGDQ